MGEEEEADNAEEVEVAHDITLQWAAMQEG